MQTEPQTIHADPIREALIEFIAAQTGETNATAVRSHIAGDELIVTYIGTDGYYAALVVDLETRELITAHENGTA